MNNRSIKFRVWDKKYKQMYGEGDIRTALAYPDEDIEIMQFTNLKDKNGKEIYEGDILECGGLGKRVVKYNQKQAAFKYYALNVNVSSEMLASNVKAYDEIIGNIYAQEAQK